MTITVTWLKGLLIGFTGFLGMVLDIYNVYLPLFMSSAFSATPFFFVGVLLRKSPILYKTNYDTRILLISIVILIGTVIYCTLLYTPNIDFRSNSYHGNILSIYIVSIILVVSLLLICKRLKWLPILSYLGRYSIIILCCHGLYIDFAYMPLYLILRRPITEFESILLVWVLCWVSIPIIKKLLPYFTAQKELIRFQ